MQEYYFSFYRFEKDKAGRKFFFFFISPCSTKNLQKCSQKTKRGVIRPPVNNKNRILF